MKKGLGKEIIDIIIGGVLGHVDLLEHHVLLFLKLIGVDLSVQEEIEKNVGSLDKVLVKNFGVVYGIFLCGLCVRMCEEQMMAKAIGFRSRGEKRSIGTPFDIQSEDCRRCGACIYIGPACQLRCTYTEPERVICGGCANLPAPCLEKEGFDDLMCYMAPCVACEIKKD